MFKNQKWKYALYSKAFQLLAIRTESLQQVLGNYHVEAFKISTSAAAERSHVLVTDILQILSLRNLQIAIVQLKKLSSFSRMGVRLKATIIPGTLSP